MNIIIQSLGFKASDDLEQLVRDRLSSLNDDRIIGANVILYKGPSGNPDADYCEIRLEVPGYDHFVKRHSPLFETSISECVEILEQQLQKAKHKRTENRQADEALIQDKLREGEEGDDDVELEDVVK